MAYTHRSWIANASCFKSSNVKSCINKDKDNTVIPISSDETGKEGHGKNISFFRKITTNCLKSPNKVDYSTPLSMSSHILIKHNDQSPKLFHSSEKIRPNSSKTFSSLELQSMGLSEKPCPYFGWCSKEKNKPRFKPDVRDDPSIKGSNPNLTSPKSESSLLKNCNGFQPRRSLPQDQLIRRSQKNLPPPKNEDRGSNNENVIKYVQNENARKSLVNGEQNLKPISCEAIAEAIRSDAVKSVTLVDCRTFVVYNNNHILGALNVSCSDCITRKRLLCGRIHVDDLVSGPDDAKIRFKQAFIDENTKLVLYDEDTKDASLLPKTHPLKVIFASICKNKTRIYYLKGGMKEYHRLYSSLCIQNTKCPQFDSIIYSPTTPIVEDNIDSATISQILPFLYIGNERDSVNADLLKRCHITHIINVTSHLPMPLPNIKYKRLPANDSSCQNLKQYFEEAIQFIDEAKDSKGRVLIHCQAGVSRSATIAMAYIMSRSPMSMMKAFKLVKRCRPIIAPNFNFLGQLLELETRLGISDSECNDVGSDKQESCEELEDRMKGLLLSNGIHDRAPSFKLSQVLSDAS